MLRHALGFTLALIAALASAQAPAQPAPSLPPVPQGSDAWCGTFLIDDSPSAPRAAIANATELSRYLNRSCRRGDVMTMTVTGSNRPQVVAAMLCDYSRTILIQTHPRDPTEISCVWTGAVRLGRPYRQ